MTDPASGRRLSVDADLRLSVDGVDATLVGRQGELALRTDEPARLSRALRRSGIVPGLRRLDQRLSTVGLHGPVVRIEGPRGRIASVTPRTDRRAPGAPPGGATVRWHRPQDLLPAWWRVVVAALVAGAVALALRRRR